MITRNISSTESEHWRRVPSLYDLSTIDNSQSSWNFGTWRKQGNDDLLYTRVLTCVYKLTVTHTLYVLMVRVKTNTFVSNVGHNVLSPYMEESEVGDPSTLLLTKL